MVYFILRWYGGIFLSLASRYVQNKDSSHLSPALGILACLSSGNYIVGKFLLASMTTDERKDLHASNFEDAKTRVRRPSYRQSIFFFFSLSLSLPQRAGNLGDSKPPKSLIGFLFRYTSTSFLLHWVDAISPSRISTVPWNDTFPLFRMPFVLLTVKQTASRWEFVRIFCKTSSKLQMLCRINWWM